MTLLASASLDVAGAVGEAVFPLGRFNRVKILFGVQLLLSIAIGISPISAFAQAPPGAVLISKTPTSCPATFKYPGYFSYGGALWNFSWTRVGPGSTGSAEYTGPFTAVSVDGSTRWNSPTMTATCNIDEYWLPWSGTYAYYFDIAEWYSGSTESTGYDPASGGTCDYQITYDPSAGTCGTGGGGGNSGSGGDPSGGDVGGSDFCVQLQLDPGCYDVYIDDTYDSTICC